MKRLARIGIMIMGMVLAGCAGRAPEGTQAGCGCGSSPNVPDRVYFDFDKATLSRQAVTVLASQATWLTIPYYNRVQIQVAGNADERGTETYNLALGQRRADAVQDALEARGVAAWRISTVSHGKDCPVAAGHDEAAWQQNRNVITSVIGFNPQRCR
jgi:peptidoglycan-associated lipoprotein